MGEVKLDGYICDRCEHTWISRNLNGCEGEEKPKVCPKCKSPYWNIPRKNESAARSVRETKKETEKLEGAELNSLSVVSDFDSSGLFPPRKLKKEVASLFPPK